MKTHIHFMRILFFHSNDNGVCNLGNHNWVVKIRDEKISLIKIWGRIGYLHGQRPHLSHSGSDPRYVPDDKLGTN